MKYFLYILSCANNYLYIGIAKDVQARFRLHVEGKGAKFTRINKPIKILYQEKVGSRSKAQKREAALKKLSRLQKEEFISQNK